MPLRLPRRPRRIRHVWAGLACATLAGAGAQACRAEVPLAHAGDTGVAPGDDASETDGTAEGLVISGEIEAASRVSGGSDPDDFDTNFSLTIRRGGQSVAAANIVVRSALGAVQLAYAGGVFVGAQHGYAREYSLDVQAGADVVRDAAFAGPQVHTFSSPATGVRYHAGDGLLVVWSPGGADSAYVSTNMLPATATPDTGMFTVPASALAGGTREHADQVIVERGVDRSVPGALPSSVVHLEVTNGVLFYVEP
jgi:hypothetical protein